MPAMPSRLAPDCTGQDPGRNHAKQGSALHTVSNPLLQARTSTVSASRAEGGERVARRTYIAYDLYVLERQHGNHDCATRTPAEGSPGRTQTQELSSTTVQAGRRAPCIGTTTETETIERALEFVVFGERLASGTARARGRAWHDVVGEMDGIASRA